MQIFTKGEAHREFAPDQIIASVSFSTHAATYDEALSEGVRRVKEYLQFIADNTDFQFEDFKTSAYRVHEEFHTNRIDPKTEADLSKNLTKRVSDGFFFTQYAAVEFDFNKERLAKLLVLTSKNPNAPRFSINFCLKDPKARERELLPEAYEDAKAKANTLAEAAGKHLRDCVRVDIDMPPHHEPMYEGAMMRKSAVRGDFGADIQDELQNIDDTFRPDDIPVHKVINCIWETSD